MLGIFTKKAKNDATHFANAVIQSPIPKAPAVKSSISTTKPITDFSGKQSPISDIKLNPHAGASKFPSGYYCKSCASKNSFPSLDNMVTEKVGGDYFFDFTECGLCLDDGAHYYYSMELTS